MAFNDAETVKSLASLMDEYKLSEIEYGSGDMHIRLSRGVAPVMTACAPAAAVSSAPAQAAEALQEPAVDEKNVVRSPMLGIVYTAPEPDAEPYVKVGDTVAADQTLFLIEAMKTFNPVKATRAGKVAKILVTDRSAVEYDDALLILE